MKAKHSFLKYSLVTLFALLYGLSAFVSGYHAIEFFSLANAYWLALLLAITFEIGQAAVLFYVLQSKTKSYGPWVLMVVLTLTQCIGNIFSSHKYMVTHSMEDIKYFTDSVLFFVADPDPKVNIVFIDYIVGFLLPIVALAMTSMVVEILKDPTIKDEAMVVENDHNTSTSFRSTSGKKMEETGENNQEKIDKEEVKEEPKPFIYF